MRDFRGKRVVVTGAGSGIGRATAIAFASRGADLVLTDLRADGLSATKAEVERLGRRATTHLVDVADAEAMAALARAVEADGGPVDVLVNNAGIGAAGRFLDTSLETWRKVLDVNLMGVVHGCRAFVPGMVARGRGGHVVNLASLAAYVAPADMPVYSTSKYAVLGLSESLRADLARHGIGVTAICPGIIHTGIIHSTILEGKAADEATRGRIESFYQKRGYGPEKVAANILAAVESNDAVRPVSPESWIMYFAKRAAPGLVERFSRVDNPFSK